MFTIIPIFSRAVSWGARRKVSWWPRAEFHGFFIFIDAANSQISLNPEKKEKNIKANKRSLFPAFSAITVHVFQSILSNQPAKSLSLFINGLFFSNLNYEVAKKIENLFCFLAANTCTYRGPIFAHRARRPRIVDVLGHWELTLVQRWRSEGMVVFLPFCVYFARLVSIIDRSNCKNCIIYL